MSYNEKALPTFLEAEPAKAGVSVGTETCGGKERAGEECAFRPSEAESAEA